MKKQIFICLALAMLLPSVVAFNCNSLSGGDFYICNSIQNTNLSQTEKDLLISDIFNKNKTSPNFDFVYSWNTNLNILIPSDGKKYSSGTIKNAWVDIVALMPSILEDNNLYASDKGKLMTAYNYEYSLPSGTEYRDCKTYYSWVSKSADLNIYFNDNFIGSDKLTAYQIFTSPDNLNFKAELNIKARYKVKHYRWEWVDGNKKCSYYSTEYRTDNIKLTDTLNAKLYKNQLSSSFRITDKYNGITQGILEANNFTKLILTFNNSQYQDNKYLYSLSYTLPYYVLTLKAEKTETINFNNIHVDKDNNKFLFTVQDTSNCKIILYNHFNSLTKTCDLSFNEINFSIKTDKTNYYENDTIKVYITPSNVEVNITYGAQSRLAKNYTEFKAVLYENKIKAKLNDEETDWLVNVNNKENSVILYNLGILSFLGYFFYKAGKVYFLQFL